MGAGPGAGLLPDAPPAQPATIAARLQSPSATRDLPCEPLRAERANPFGSTRLVLLTLMLSLRFHQARPQHVEPALPEILGIGNLRACPAAVRQGTASKSAPLRGDRIAVSRPGDTCPLGRFRGSGRCRSKPTRYTALDWLKFLSEKESGKGTVCLPIARKASPEHNVRSELRARAGRKSPMPPQTACLLSPAPPRWP